MSNNTAPAKNFGQQLTRFLHTETAAGMMLVIAAILAMIVKNSPLSDLYASFLAIEGEVRIGTLAVEKALFLWVNDGLMAVFFFLIGLELKREVLHGHLADRRQIVLPAAGAIGGVAVPAGIYIALNINNPEGAIVGWAIPTATDIAFALGVLALLGPSIPPALRVFLMTLAIIDDLVAIIIIGLFYTSGLSFVSLTSATVFLLILLTLNRCKVTALTPYILAGIALWVCVLKSGVHATLAGVLVALFIPSIKADDDVEPPLDSLIADLHPWIAFAILPLFAFVNAGVSFDGLNIGKLFDPVPLGIALGLLVGKPVGVLFFCTLAIASKTARLPANVNWGQFVGVACLCGVGFTMSLFIGGLAFAEEGTGYARIERLGMLIGSLSSALLGYLILRLSTPQKPAPPPSPFPNPDHTNA